MHREKIEARLSEARHQQTRMSTNTIHVRSGDDDNDESSLNSEQLAANETSVRVLSARDTGNADETPLANIYI
jgi:hypothetical protein